jgi:hypothetical protein
MKGRSEGDEIVGKRSMEFWAIRRKDWDIRQQHQLTVMRRE